MNIILQILISAAGSIFADALELVFTQTKKTLSDRHRSGSDRPEG